jgi:RimJ/RimL family protein N-acetyltransferase
MQRISLVSQTPEHFRALLEGIEAYERRFGVRVAEGVRDFLAGPEVSAEFLERLNGSAAADPWKDGFAVVHFADNTVIGLCSFTSPPSADETVEIAYGIAPGYQNRGHATEAAQELIKYAVASGRVRTIPSPHSARTQRIDAGFAEVRLYSPGRSYALRRRGSVALGDAAERRLTLARPLLNFELRWQLRAAR